MPWTLWSTRRAVIIAFLLINTLALGVLAHWVEPHSYRHRAPWQSLVLHLSTGEDSWWHMSEAIDHLRQPHHQPIYSALLQRNAQLYAASGIAIKQRHVKFQYPLSSLLLFIPLQDFSDWLGLSRDKLSPGLNRNRLMSLIAWPFLLATLLASAAIFETQARKRPATDLRTGPIATTAMVAAAGLTFFPLITSYALGQIQVWINAFFAIALWAYIVDRKRLAGVCVGLMCLIKPQYILFLLWGAWRREWTFAASALAVALVGALASLVAFGWADNIDYMTALSFLSQRGESYYYNQSINGLLNRIMSLSDPIAYPNQFPVYFPPYTPMVHVGTLISSAILITAAFAWRTCDGVKDFCIMAISLTVASPIAWEHHYGVLFPIFVLLAAQTSERRALIWLAVSYALCSQWWVGANHLADTPLNFLQSHMLAGALILLLLFYRTSDGQFALNWDRRLAGISPPQRLAGNAALSTSPAPVQSDAR